MILFGINFNLYFLLLLKDWKSVLKNEELRVYLGVVAAGDRNDYDQYIEYV